MTRIHLTGLLLGTMAVAAASTTATVTYYRDVLPILQDHCQSCHRLGQIAPMSLTTYRETRPWAEAMKYVVTVRKMPPWYADVHGLPSARHNPLRPIEIETIVKWVDEGAEEGDFRDAPPPMYIVPAASVNRPR